MSRKGHKRLFFSSLAAAPVDVTREGVILMVFVGYSDYQVYLMLSCAPIQGHVGGLVDVSLQFSWLLPGGRRRNQG